MMHAKWFMATLFLATVVGAALAAPSYKWSGTYHEVDIPEEVVDALEEVDASEKVDAPEEFDIPEDVEVFEVDAPQQVAIEDGEPLTEEFTQVSEFLFNNKKAITSTSEAPSKPKSDKNGNGGKPGNGNGGKPGNGNGGKPGNDNGGKPGNGNGGKPGNGNGGKPGNGNGETPGNGNGGKPGNGNGGKPGNGNEGAPLHHQQKRPMNGFFDKIFAIPINILQSVNMLLNQKHQYMIQASAGASGQGKPGAPSVPTQSIYDGIFNIPITILKSVMNLLKWFVN